MRILKGVIYVLFAIVFFILGVRAYALPTAEEASKNTQQNIKQDIQLRENYLLERITLSIDGSLDYYCDISIEGIETSIVLKVIKKLKSNGYETVENNNVLRIKWGKK